MCDTGRWSIHRQGVFTAIRRADALSLRCVEIHKYFQVAQNKKSAWSLTQPQQKTIQSISIEWLSHLVVGSFSSDLTDKMLNYSGEPHCFRELSVSDRTASTHLVPCHGSELVGVWTIRAHKRGQSSGWNPGAVRGRHRPGESGSYLRHCFARHWLVPPACPCHQLHRAERRLFLLGSSVRLPLQPSYHCPPSHGYLLTERGKSASRHSSFSVAQWMFRTIFFYTESIINARADFLDSPQREAKRLKPPWSILRTILLP